MQTRKKGAAADQVLAKATSSHETANSRNTVFNLSNLTPAQIFVALDESNMFLATDLVEDMYECFHAASTYLANASESGNLNPETIADEIFSIYFKPFKLYYYLFQAGIQK
jgi:hypothetical protein